MPNISWLADVTPSTLRRQREIGPRAEPPLIATSFGGQCDGCVALQEIADSQSDVDAYIALIPVEDRARSHMGTEIGRRLLGAGRATEAFAALEKARPCRRSRPSRSSFHSTSVLPDWIALRQAARPGRSSRRPEAKSS